jgi:hypothetical protein
MFRFIGDMFIGWIVFTDSGKKTMNKLFNHAYKKAKNKIINSPQFKEIMSINEIFDKDNQNVKSNNRPKN